MERTHDSKKHKSDCSCIDMSLYGKLDDRERAPCIDDSTARVQSSVLQEESQHRAGYKVKNHEHAFEEKQVAWRQKVTEQVNSLGSGRIERRHVAETAIIVDNVPQMHE
jgi:hypothetical protein